MFCRRSDVDSQLYDYYMDPQIVNRNVAVCSGVTPGVTQCTNPGFVRKTMREYGDPALFGRSALSSGCPPPRCGNQDINAFTSTPRCKPAWSGLVQSKDDSSLSEREMSGYTMFPDAWSDGYRGINVNQFVNARLLESMEANRRFTNCKKSCISGRSYASYGV